VGHHDAYSTRLQTLPEAARRLEALPVLFVGVRCPLEEIMRRRDEEQPGRGGPCEVTAPDGAIPEPIIRWQKQVHIPGIYDLEVDTSVMAPAEWAALILERLKCAPQPSALHRLALEG
jgi:chloramphenicol 3-O phosphotransferase